MKEETAVALETYVAAVVTFAEMVAALQPECRQSARMVVHAARDLREALVEEVDK